MGKQIHRSRKLAAPTRMGATRAVSILTHRGDTTPITSVMEGTPASSYQQHEWAHNSERDRGPTQRLKHSPIPLPSTEALPLSTEPSLKISMLTTAHQTDAPCTTHLSSSDSLLDSSSSSLYIVRQLRHTFRHLFQYRTTPPSTIVTAGGTPIVIDIHLRTAGWPTQ